MLDYYLILRKKPENKVFRTILIYSYNAIMLIICMLLIFGCSKKQSIPPIPDTYLTLRIESPYSSDYILELNNTEIDKGILENSWNDIIIKNQVGEYDLYYWSDNNYIEKLSISNYDSSLNKTITKELPNGMVKGIINAYLNKKIISNSDETYILTINGTSKNLLFCVYWTVGILDVTYPDNYVKCENNYWKNNTIYGNFTDNNYICNDLVAECDYREGDICYQNYKPNLDITYDKCYLLSKTIKDESIEIPLYIKTMDYYDIADYLNLYIYDMDYNQNNRLFNKYWLYDINELKFKGELR